VSFSLIPSSGGSAVFVFRGHNAEFLGTKRRRLWRKNIFGEILVSRCNTHKLLVYADDVNLLDDNIDIIKKNTPTLINAIKEVRLYANAEKTKYMLLSRHQNVGQNCDIKIVNKCF
jgi:hypothetical protein